MFLNTQQDHAAQRIGKGRICLPDAFGETAQRLFRLDAVVFPISRHIHQIDHGRHLLLPLCWFHYIPFPRKMQCRALPDGERPVTRGIYFFSATAVSTR